MKAMNDMKPVRRSLKQEISRISLAIKQVEFRLLRVRNFLRRRLRHEVLELKRLRDSLTKRILALSDGMRLQEPNMEAIRIDIVNLQERCRQIRLQAS